MANEKTDVKWRDLIEMSKSMEFSISRITDYSTQLDLIQEKNPKTKKLTTEIASIINDSNKLLSTINNLYSVKCLESDFVLEADTVEYLRLSIEVGELINTSALLEENIKQAIKGE